MPIILLTGATDGIGRETARQLVRRGADVIVHGRSRTKVEDTVRELEDLGGRKMPRGAVADFASLREVKALGGALASREERIDVVLHNAGLFANEVAKSADGFELTFAVNHLAPFALTHVLLPRLRDGKPARIVVVSSMAHASGSIDLSALGSTKRFSPYSAYASSKLANVLFAFELARRLEGEPITVNALHPGVVSTKLLTDGFGMRGGESLEEGAKTSVKLALDPALATVTGKYFSHQREAPPSRAAEDRELARRLYDMSAELAGVDPLTSPRA